MSSAQGEASYIFAELRVFCIVEDLPAPQHDPVSQQRWAVSSTGSAAA